MSFLNLKGREKKLSEAIPPGMHNEAASVLRMARSSGPYTCRVEPASGTHEVRERGHYHKSLSQAADRNGWGFVRNLLYAAGCAVGAFTEEDSDFN